MNGRGRRLAAVALAVSFAAGPAGASRLVADSSGTRIAWPAAARPAAVSFADSAERAFWRARLADPASAATALHVLADLRLAAGDSAGADSCALALASRRSPWQWPALDRATARSLTRSGAAPAESLLASAARDDWAEPERAAWLDRRAQLRLAAGDTAQALAFTRQVLQAYPAVAAPAAAAFARLDSLAAARGDSLAPRELREGAEAAYFRGARPLAIALLRRAFARADSAGRFEAALRLAQVLRESRYPLTASGAAATARRLASGPVQGARADLERARALRDAARTDSALAMYARVARAPVEPELRATAWWESAREAEDRGRYRDALAAFERARLCGPSRADAATFHAGLMRLALGARDSACATWRRLGDENARFWLAVALRASERPSSDSLLLALARQPGYGFYRAAARETLGVRGYPAGLAPAAPAETLTIDGDVRALLAHGRVDDAATLLSRWAAGDARAGAGRGADRAGALAAAALAYDADRPAIGTRLAERAFAESASDSEAWAVVPWAYPPAFEAEVAAESSRVEPALLRALIRQESRFDPRARSRSDALGLTQLKLATAGDMARALHEPAPVDTTLFDPAHATRWGARYLSLLLARFGGDVAVALAAYNAGASNVRPDWRELVARGGEALYCELASNADSQDYVRRILGFRQAYRELRPGAAP